MNVSEAVARRISIRAFKPDPVAGEVVQDILVRAASAPSGGNLQPWRVYALAGEPLAQFKALVCTKIPTFMKCSNVIIDVRQASSFSTASTSTPTITYDGSGNAVQGAYTPGIGGTVNVVKIMYIWDVQKGPLGFDLSTLSSGKRLLISTSVFRVEPYIS